MKNWSNKDIAVFSRWVKCSGSKYSINIWISEPFNIKDDDKVLLLSRYLIEDNADDNKFTLDIN